MQTDMYSVPAGYSVSETDILSWAESILVTRFKRSNYLTTPDLARHYLRVKFGRADREQFGMVLLDNQHGVIGLEVLFYGTIDSASVYPREVVKAALAANAAAVLFVHNHPSGNPEPSRADIQITRRLSNALNLVDIRALDHLIIGGQQILSLSEQGLMPAVDEPKENR